jgi:superfamily II DNA or RNA helicase
MSAVHDIGILNAATAFGKTVVAVKLIAVRKRNTLILVHRRQLLNQLHEKIAMFLSIPQEQIGIIGGGKRKPTKIVTA